MGGSVADVPIDTGTAELAGGLGGPATGTEQLVPLRGGCSSTRPHGGHGGGAIQLSGRIAISILGAIDARGGAGKPVGDFAGAFSVVGGGGAGGGILLEAPDVSLSSSARLLAGGGAGASRQMAGGTSEQQAAPGASCSLTTCGAGGSGAHSDSPAGAGVAITYEEGTSTGGGGGGGLGRVRINTATASYDKASTTVEVGALTVGQIAK
jgi:hypothetical protein